MSALLPLADTAASFERIRRDDAALLPGVRAICARHGLLGSPSRFAAGSLPVYAIGDDTVVKLYPPIDAEHFTTERTVLLALENRLPLPTPALLAAGELDAWTYVVMRRLHGEPLHLAWPTIPPRDRAALMETLGASLAALHATPIAPTDPLRIDWSAFLARQRAHCAERHRARGLDAAWSDQIDAFLDATPLDATAPVLLHTEVMREHLLVREHDGHWTLSGLVDFEPAMVGAREYELGSVGVFVTCGEPGLLGRLLRAYGLPPAALDEALQRRAMAYALLHRYSNLAWYLQRLPPPSTVTTLAALAARWWAY